MTFGGDGLLDNVVVGVQRKAAEGTHRPSTTPGKPVEAILIVSGIYRMILNVYKPSKVLLRKKVLRPTARGKPTVLELEVSARRTAELVVGFTYCKTHELSEKPTENCTKVAKKGV